MTDHPRLCDRTREQLRARATDRSPVLKTALQPATIETDQAARRFVWHGDANHLVGEGRAVPPIGKRDHR
jgi:hypothetical protein